MNYQLGTDIHKDMADREALQCRNKTIRDVFWLLACIAGVLLLAGTLFNDGPVQ